MSDFDGNANSNTQQLLTQLNQPTKQHLVFDSPSDKRPKYIFTAPIGAKNGDPCTVTEYVYLETSNTTLIVNMQERSYRWNSAWETNKPFVFDPQADIDPDGDGYL